ncbi:MAG: Wzz/FepE/Etk N-terminal domain-containing protein [Bacteroidia bacterium]
MEYNFNLAFILNTLWRYRWYVASIVGIAAVIAIVLTMPSIWKPEYLARTVIYPTNPERYDVTGLFAEEPSVYLYGDAKNAERLRSIATSAEVMYMVIDSADLWWEYGVDKENDASPKFYAGQAYRSKVSIAKTEGNGLEISAYDTDPERAAKIVNLIMKFSDLFYQRMLNENKERILSLYQKSRDRIEHQLKIHADSVSRARVQFNIFETESQTRALLDALLDAQADLGEAQARYEMYRRRGSSQAVSAKMEVEVLEGRVAALTKSTPTSPVNLEDFQKGMDIVSAMGQVTRALAFDLKGLETKIEYLTLMSGENYSTILITEPAGVPDRKARPVRGIIVIATVIITTVIALIAVLLIDLLTNKKTTQEAEAGNETRTGNKTV